MYHRSGRLFITEKVLAMPDKSDYGCICLGAFGKKHSIFWA
jgi:hypothetical protein